jgi:hypothetical protein
VTAAKGHNPLHFKPPNFNGVISWAVFHRQFEAAAFQNIWTANKKTAHFLSALQGKTADILHTVAVEAMYENIVGALHDRLRYHQLAAAYRTQLRP